MKILPLLVLLVPLTLHASLQDLLGPSLVDANGNPMEVSSLDGKVVGLYFSAQWCPPCRKFTPLLVEARDANQKDFEVVFVSSDQSEAAQKKYMQDADMKWPAIPFDSEKREALGEKFGIRGIPSLVVVDDKGNLITAHGRGEISANADEAIRNWTSAAKAGADAVSSE